MLRQNSILDIIEDSFAYARKQDIKKLPHEGGNGVDIRLTSMYRAPSYLKHENCSSS